MNPYAVAIARFRLLLVALRESGISRLQEAPDFHLNLAAGDSLLHGVPGREQEVMGFHELAHHYQTEDLATLRRLLQPETYHAVVANPPYITVKDRALNQAYRDRYSTCLGKYSLSVPFMERISCLAMQNGFTGQITANSFMKREFGKTLIESFLPKIDLTHIIDTSGAYIPGHTTPTVILFSRNRKPVAPTIRTAMGVRGEPSTPDFPEQGLVWRAIMEHIDSLTSANGYVTVADSPRTMFEKHPWTLAGGGASELKKFLDEARGNCLGDITSSIGYASFPGLDEGFVSDREALRRLRVPQSLIKTYVDGESVRDWSLSPQATAITPYDENFELINIDLNDFWGRYLWGVRTNLGNIKSFAGKTRNELGDKWWGWYRWP